MIRAAVPTIMPNMDTAEMILTAFLDLREKKYLRAICVVRFN